VAAINDIASFLNRPQESDWSRRENAQVFLNASGQVRQFHRCGEIDVAS
jgi:hypothetical protein